MSGKAQLTAADVERGLKSAGFTKLKQRGTSHIHWVKTSSNGKRQYKVTVDPPKEPFSEFLVKSMASQAGMSVSQFYEICCKEGQKAAKRGALQWLADLFA